MLQRVGNNHQSMLQSVLSTKGVNAVTHFNYGGKIGMSTLIVLTIKLCALYVTYAPSIKTYINAQSTITTEQKAVVIAWLDGIVAACEILRVLQVKYER